MAKMGYRRLFCTSEIITQKNKIFIIFFLIQILFVCLSSVHSASYKDQDAQSILTDLMNQMNENLDRLEVPVQFIRQYGFYFFEDKGYTSFPLYCDIQGFDLHTEYEKLVSDSTKIISLFFVKMKTFNSITSSAYSDLILRLVDVEGMDSNSNFFVFIFDQKKRLAIYKDIFLSWLSVLDNLEITLENSISNLKRISSLINKVNPQTEIENFCKTFYESKINNLGQSMLIFKSLLLSIQAKDPSEILNQLFISQYRDIFKLLVSDYSYFSLHLSLISNANIKMESILSNCISNFTELSLPLFGGSDPKNEISVSLPTLFKLSFGANEDMRSASKFGLALDELARDHVFLIKSCKSSINDFLLHFKSQWKLIESKLRISIQITEKLKTVLSDKELILAQFNLFKDYVSSSTTPINSSHLIQLITAESVNNLAVIVFGVQIQLQEILKNLESLFNLYSINLYPKLLWDIEFTFPISLLSDNYKFDQKFLAAAKIIGIIMDSISKLKQVENRAIRFLNFNIFSKLLLLFYPTEKEAIQKILNRIHNYIRIKGIHESYLNNVSLLREQGHNLDKEISDSLEAHFSNKDLMDDEICFNIKDYFAKLSNDKFNFLIQLIDKRVFEMVSIYRKERDIFNENFSSLDTLMSLNFGFGDKYREIIDFLGLFYKDSLFENYVSIYVKMRSCIGFPSKHSLLTNLGYTPSHSETSGYQAAVNAIISESELELSKESLMEINIKEVNELISIVKNTFEIHLLAQIYLIGSINQVNASKSISQKTLTKDDLNFIYESIVTNSNIFFQKKGIRPVIFDNADFKARLNYLYTLFNSYYSQISVLENVLNEEKDKFLGKNLEITNSQSNFLDSVEKMMQDLFLSVLDMFQRNLLTQSIQQDILDVVSILYTKVLTPECYKILREFRTIYILLDLVSGIRSGNSLKIAMYFMNEIIDKSIYESDALELPINNISPNYLASLSPSNYPGSILLKKSQIQSHKVNPDLNCRVAYIDLDEDLLSDTYSNHQNSIDLYNVVTIYCNIQNSSGETLNDFLMKRSAIKGTETVVLQESVIKFLADKIYLNYLAVDYKLANSNVYIEQLEMELNQYFVLIPELKVDYFINLDILLFSASHKHFKYIEKIINFCLNMYLNLDSLLNGFSRSFLMKSNYLKLHYPTDTYGNSIKLLTVGKYSGFGGETPISISFVEDSETEPFSYIDDLSADLFQKSALNYRSVYMNLAPLKFSTIGKEYIWITTRKSHISYMMLLRNELINDSLRNGRQKNLIYVGAMDKIDQEAISSMNILFNSMLQREIASSMFFDVTKNTVMLLVDKDLPFTTSNSMNEVLSIKLGIYKYFFENVEVKQTKILENPVYEIEMRQTVDSYISDSLPRFCSSRRNYYSNSVVLSITKDFTLKDVFSYRLLLKILNPSISLKVRNLPSQNALRNIYNIHDSYYLDIDNLKYSFISPLRDLNDRNLLSAIQRDTSFALKKSILHSSCTQLSRFTPDISLSSLGFEMVFPENNAHLHITQGDEVVNINGIVYLVIRYEVNNLSTSLSRYVRELLMGRSHILLIEKSVDVSKMKQEDLPTGNSSSELHLLKGISIELVKKEHLIRIWLSYFEEDLELIHNIMKIYRGYNISIMTRYGEMYYFYKMCFDASNSPKHCTYINVFRYLSSNLFEQLTLYQIALNINLSLSVIAEEGELISDEMIGLNVITRFGGSVLFRSDGFLELHYPSQQYWDACAFVQEYYRFSKELPVKLINFDEEVSDILFDVGDVECPLPPIPNLGERNSLHHFIELHKIYDQSNIQSYTFTLYESMRYQILEVYLNFYVSGNRLFIRHEGSDALMISQSIYDILQFFSIGIVTEKVVKVELKEISFKDEEIESAKIVAKQIGELIPNIQVVGYNTKGDMVAI